jgi:hypothetical protein
MPSGFHMTGLQRARAHSLSLSLFLPLACRSPGVVIRGFLGLGESAVLCSWSGGLSRIVADVSGHPGRVDNDQAGADLAIVRVGRGLVHVQDAQAQREHRGQGGSVRGRHPVTPFAKVQTVRKSRAEEKNSAKRQCDVGRLTNSRSPRGKRQGLRGRRNLRVDTVWHWIRGPVCLSVTCTLSLSLPAELCLHALHAKCLHSHTEHMCQPTEPLSTGGGFTEPLSTGGGFTIRLFLWLCCLISVRETDSVFRCLLIQGDVVGPHSALNFCDLATTHTQQVINRLPKLKTGTGAVFFSFSFFDRWLRGSFAFRIFATFPQRSPAR